MDEATRKIWAGKPKWLTQCSLCGGRGFTLFESGGVCFRNLESLDPDSAQSTWFCGGISSVVRSVTEEEWLAIVDELE